MGAFNDMDVHIAEYIQLQIPIIHQIFALNKKTLELSRYDNLTGLMNRGYFNTIFDDRLNFARRDKSIISLIMFDLDGLKIINDNFGHAAGDDYLKHFAHFIESQFRSTDTFARIGGDEFLGIFNTTDPLALKKKLSLLQTLYSEMPIDLEETSFTGSFSYGIATYPEDADTTDGLLTVADIKMYLDKKKIEVYIHRKTMKHNNPQNKAGFNAHVPPSADCLGYLTRTHRRAVTEGYDQPEIALMEHFPSP